MKLLPICFSELLIFLLLSQNTNCGLLDMISPSYLLETISGLNPFQTRAIELPENITTVDLTDKVKLRQLGLENWLIIDWEEFTFITGSKFQSFFDPSDVRAKRNYIMSPMSTSILLAEYLMGTNGWNHNCISKLMNLNDKAKREIMIFEQIRDPLYDDKIYHGAYHFRLKTLSRSEVTDEEQDKVKISNAFFHKNDAHLVSHFHTTTENFYQTNFRIVDFSDVSKSSAAIAKVSSDTLGFDISNQTKLESDMIKPNTESVLLNTFLFTSTWKIPLKKSEKKELFFVKPFQKQKIFYLKGNLTNTVYVDSSNFTLVGIPLSHKNCLLYIVLPKGDQFTNYNIRLFSEQLNNYESFKDTIEKQKVLRNVTLKVPDIFTQFIEFDIMEPLLNYINEESSINSKESVENVRFNSAASDLLLNNMVQHVYFSITNKIEPESSTIAATTLKPKKRMTTKKVEKGKGYQKRSTVVPRRRKSTTSKSKNHHNVTVVTSKSTRNDSLLQNKSTKPPKLILESKIKSSAVPTQSTIKTDSPNSKRQKEGAANLVTTTIAYSQRSKVARPSTNLKDKSESLKISSETKSQDTTVPTQTKITTHSVNTKRRNEAAANSVTTTLAYNQRYMVTHPSTNLGDKSESPKISSETKSQATTVPTQSKITTDSANTKRRNEGVDNLVTTPLAYNPPYKVFRPSTNLGNRPVDMVTQSQLTKSPYYVPQKQTIYGGMYPHVDPALTAKNDYRVPNIPALPSIYKQPYPKSSSPFDYSKDKSYLQYSRQDSGSSKRQNEGAANLVTTTLAYNQRYKQVTHPSTNFGDKSESPKISSGTKSQATTVPTQSKITTDSANTKRRNEGVADLVTTPLAYNPPYKVFRPSTNLGNRPVDMVTQSQFTKSPYYEPQKQTIYGGMYSQVDPVLTAKNDYKVSNIPALPSIYKQPYPKSSSPLDYSKDKSNLQYSRQDSGSTSKRSTNYFTSGTDNLFTELPAYNYNNVYPNYPAAQNNEYDPYPAAQNNEYNPYPATQNNEYDPFPASQSNEYNPYPEIIRYKRYSAPSSKSENAAIDFNVTRPFVFLVMDEDTKLVLLWGSISDPLKLQ